MKKIFIIIMMVAFFATSPTVFAAQGPKSRIKDIANFEGVRSNMLIGYGLIVGLAGTGDSANSIPFTRQTLINILERLGVNSKAAEAKLKTKNVAAVMVTTEMPTFARQGGKLDVTVASLGDAKSIEGGMLVAVPLRGADGKTYAVAQGPVIIGGFVAEGKAGTIVKSHLTSGHITSGAIIEVETGHELADLKNLRLILKNPDFTTATNIAKVINKSFGEPVSTAIDNNTVDITVPENLRPQMASIINKIEHLKVNSDQTARVVVDEKTGTIVMGQDVRITPVAISHANVTIRIQNEQQVSQDGGMYAYGAQSEAVVATLDEENADGAKFAFLNSGANLADLVDGLNALGVKPRDIISILQTIKAAGALQADIKLM